MTRREDFARGSQNDGSEFLILADMLQTIQQFEHELERKGIAAIGPIKRDHCQIVFPFKANVLVTHRNISRARGLIHRDLPGDDGQNRPVSFFLHILVSQQSANHTLSHVVLDWVTEANGIGGTNGLGPPSQPKSNGLRQQRHAWPRVRTREPRAPSRPAADERSSAPCRSASLATAPASRLCAEWRTAQ